MGTALLVTGAPGAGKTTLVRALSTEPILGTILQVPHSWLDGLKHRHNVELYRLTERNREDLTDALLARPGGELCG
jgi:nucleoside-triphosphatase THEP1